MKTEFTRKIYHKKFDHRLVIKVRSNSPRKYEGLKQPTSEVIEWLLACKFDRQDWKAHASYSYVNYNQNYTIYFTDTKVLDFIKEQVDAQYLELLEKPIDAEHTKMLMDNTKLVTRKTLFYGKYRMALRVAPKRLSQWQTSTQNIKDMKAWCVEQFGQDASKYCVQGYARGNFYFAQASDALLFKLTWGGDDVQTERVVTVAELEAMRENAQ